MIVSNEKQTICKGSLAELLGDLEGCVNAIHNVLIEDCKFSVEHSKEMIALICYRATTDLSDKDDEELLADISKILVAIVVDNSNMPETVKEQIKDQFEKWEREKVDGDL